ncbi:MAG: hypothetical protein ABI855_12650, partial [Bacteroidota bacterium]
QNCFSQNHSSDYFVHLKGNVQIIHAYKGGAAPDKEILEKISKPVPLTDTQLFLKKTYYGSVSYTLQTDSTGNFDLNIKPGVYNIYLSGESASEKKMTDSSDVQSICEENFKSQSHGQLKVFRKGNSPLNITIKEKINPCGVLPPAAEPKQN